MHTLLKSDPTEDMLCKRWRMQRRVGRGMIEKTGMPTSTLPTRDASALQHPCRYIVAGAPADERRDASAPDTREPRRALGRRFKRIRDVALASRGADARLARARSGRR
eukprot:364752-Chlamydomonas_euryale.AAC.9